MQFQLVGCYNRLLYNTGGCRKFWHFTAMRLLNIGDELLYGKIMSIEVTKKSIKDTRRSYTSLETTASILISPTILSYEDNNCTKFQ